VAVGGGEDSAIAFVFNHGEKPLRFLLGEEGDDVAAIAAAVGLWGGCSHGTKWLPSLNSKNLLTRKALRQIWSTEELPQGTTKKKPLLIVEAVKSLFQNLL